MTDPRIQLDGEGMPDPGRLDEFFSDDVRSVHFEAMDEAQFWMLIVTNDGRHWHINCGAVNTKAKGYCRLEGDS